MPVSAFGILFNSSTNTIHKQSNTFFLLFCSFYFYSIYFNSIHSIPSIFSIPEE